jgi:hypothetical protein
MKSTLRLLPKPFLLAATLAVGGGCSVGHQFAYGGRSYTMTQANIDYVQKTWADMKALAAAHPEIIENPGPDFETKPLGEQIRLLELTVAVDKDLCERWKRYVANAPVGSGFTSAAEILATNEDYACNVDLDLATYRLKNWREFAAREVARKRREAIAEVVKQCGTQLQTQPTACAIDEVTATEKASCEKDCSEQRQVLLRQVFTPVMNECTTQWLSQHPKCDATAGLSDQDRTECQKACADSGQRGYQNALRARA